MAITQRGSVLVAADAAASDFYGRAVALSANGLVMAVGANQWEGGASDQGGVYIYDWSGSAWVARGSVLEAADAAASRKFGTAVSLSDDGEILAVADYISVYIYDWSGSAWVARGSKLTDGNIVGAVSLSGDGSVMAIGEPNRFDVRGRVYIYDWSGSAWVARGSALIRSDDITFSAFGDSVALSSAGTVLAVGCSMRDVSGDEGAVYVFDWSGSAWVERSPILIAADATTNDFFGSGVALSDNASMLAVGAYQAGAEGGGRVYLYDWLGGSWVQRSLITAPDYGAGDTFGMSVALSGAGDVLAIGAMKWDSATDQGGVYIYDIEPENIVTAPTELTMLLSNGVAIAPTELTMDARAYAPTSLTLLWPSGTASAPTSLTMIAHGAASAPTTLALIDTSTALATAATVWSARCLIDGVDVSASLVGQASVTCDEGAARIASLTLLPPSGSIDPMDYVGKRITLDYVLVVAGTPVPRRLFTGRIDTPEYDPASTLLTLTCTDDMQNIIAALPRSTIDHLIGGRFTEAVQGEIDDNWYYAQARLTTVAGSLDASASGGLRTTLWDTSGTWATFTDSDLIYQQSRLLLPQRSRLINKVEIGFDYRFMRLHQRQTSLDWSGTLPEMAKNGYQYPTQQEILGAAEGTGWTVTRSFFWPAPAAIEVEFPVGPSLLSGFFYPPAGSVNTALLHVAHRHSQTVTEHYTITVTAHGSVAANGELPSSLRGALASDFSGDNWESALDVEPLMLGGGVLDYAPDADRAAADYAIQTLLDQAEAKILSSHRSGRVGNAILCNPDLDLDKRVAIDTAQISASGKVAQVVHVLDFAAGSAVSEFSLAISGAGGTASGADTLAPPPPRLFVDSSLDWVYEIPPLSCHTFGVAAYDEGLMGLLLNPSEFILVEDIPAFGTINTANPFYTEGSYPVTGFRVQMPGVDDVDRDPVDDPVTASYSIIVPDDTLTFTVP